MILVDIDVPVMGKRYDFQIDEHVPLSEVKPFEQKALAALKANYPEYLEQISEEKVISDELDKKLTEFYDNFLKEFVGEEQAA